MTDLYVFKSNVSYNSVHCFKRNELRSIEYLSKLSKEFTNYLIVRGDLKKIVHDEGLQVIHNGRLFVDFYYSIPIDMVRKDVIKSILN